MFEIENKYSEEIQDLIDKIETKQVGLQVIKVKKWGLPINKYILELEISKAKNFNIVEEFIIKITLANIGTEVTEEIIQSMLGLDKVFICKCINRLADGGVFDKKALPKIKITKLGKQQFEKGQVLKKEKSVRLEAFINQKFKLFYGKEYEKKEEYPLIDLEEEIGLSSSTIENDSSLKKRLIDIAKEEKMILSRESLNQFISNIRLIASAGSHIAMNFIETWIYDLVEDKLYCKVWDCQQSRYSKELSEFISCKQPLTRNDFEIENEMNKTAISSLNKYEEIFKEEIKAQREEGVPSKLSLKMLRGSDIKTEFNRCLKGANKYLYIQSPWISAKVVDNEMIQLFKKLVSKNCKIFISWGIARDINKEDRRANQELIDKLRAIKKSNGMPGIFIYWIGNHHNKEIIVDNNCHFAGSFNWLSYRGDYLPRGESVYITSDKVSINDAKVYWEKQVFSKISEDIWKEDYIREINSMINLETLMDKVKEKILDEITKLVKNDDKKVAVKIYNIALIYFKNNLFDEVFEKSILYLVQKNQYLREVYIIISNLKRNNKAKVFYNIMDVYKEKFVKAKIIDSNFKAHKSLNNKNLAKSLKFM